MRYISVYEQPGHCILCGAMVYPGEMCCNECYKRLVNERNTTGHCILCRASINDEKMCCDDCYKRLKMSRNQTKHCILCGEPIHDEDACCENCYKRMRSKHNPIGRCENCGKPVNYKDMYCSTCGTFNNNWRETTQEQCGNCHAHLEPNDIYCRRCGTRVGDGAYEPYQDIMQCIYGPMPVDRTHICKKCGNEWTTHSMIDSEKYCPRCGAMTLDNTRDAFTIFHTEGGLWFV